MLTYHPLTAEEYTAALLKLIVSTEGFEPRNQRGQRHIFSPAQNNRR